VKIVLDFNSGANSAPSGFETAVQYAANYLGNLITNNITVTIQVGYGSLGGGAIGEGGPSEGLLSYSEVRSELLSHATTAAAESAAEALPTSDPTGGRGVAVSLALQKAWGLMAANSTEQDGSVTFGSDTNNMFDYNPTGPVPNSQVYFVGVAFNELTHALGRMSVLGNGNGIPWGMLNLVQYTAPGQLAAVSSNRETSYLSVDGGKTNLGTFSNTLDPTNWAAGHSPDGLNLFAGYGAVNSFSQADIDEMNAIGFDVACFATGTRIATANGEVRVESLRAGEDVAITEDGSPVPIVWIGHRNVVTALHERPEDVMPVRVRRDAIAPGQPVRDLILSPDHALALDGVLIPVRYLINGQSIVQEHADRITYWHVELARHDILLADGLPTESFLDTGNRSAFANGGKVVQFVPLFARDVWDAESCAPLVISGPVLDRAYWRIARRAEDLSRENLTDAIIDAIS
jgi:hypothetical protein